MNNPKLLALACLAGSLAAKEVAIFGMKGKFTKGVLVQNKPLSLFFLVMVVLTCLTLQTN